MIRVSSKEVQLTSLLLAPATMFFISANNESSVDVVNCGLKCGKP